MLLDCCRALPLQMGSARGMFSNWDALHLGMFQVYWERDDVYVGRHLSKSVSLLKRALLSCRRQVGQFRSRGAGKLRQAKGRSVDDLSTVLAYVSRSYRWLNMRSVRPTRVSRYSVSSTVGE